MPREDTPLVPLPPPPAGGPGATHQSYQQQQPPAPLLAGADPELAAAFEEGAWRRAQYGHLCLGANEWIERRLGNGPRTQPLTLRFPRPTKTVTANRPRRMLVTSLVALALLVLAGLGMARVEKAATPQQGLDGAFFWLFLWVGRLQVWLCWFD